MSFVWLLKCFWSSFWSGVLDRVGWRRAIKFCCEDSHKDRIEHARIQLYQLQSHSLGLIPGLKAFFVRKLKKKKKKDVEKNWKGTSLWARLITSLSSIAEARVIPERGGMHICELPNLTVTWSSLVSAHSITIQLPWPPVLTFNYISTLIFFIPIIPTFATILLFECLSAPFWSREGSRNAFLNGAHDTLIRKEISYHLANKSVVVS